MKQSAFFTIKTLAGYSLALLSVSALLSTSALATPPVIPQAPSWQPGQAGQRLSVPVNPTPDVGGQPGVTVSGDHGEQNLQGDIQFTLNSLTVQGATAFSGEALKSEYAPYVGKNITLKTLSDIANHITVRYRNAGYILSRAVVPPQRIAGGNVTIQVVEGYINTVEFSGVPGDSWLLKGYAKSIEKDRPLNSATLERYLLLMQDLPGVTARAIIRPAAEATGAADLVISMDVDHVDGSVTADNRGSRYVGPVQTGLTANANNILGLYERTQLHGVVTAQNNELHYIQLGHEEQLNSEGTKATLSYAHTNSNPAYRLSAFGIESQDNDFSVALSHPFIRSRLANLYVNSTVEARNTVVDALGALLYQDRLRVLRVGSTYDFVDSSAAVNRFGGTVSKGFYIDQNDQGVSHSREKGDPSFLKAEAQISRLQPVYGPVSFYAAATGQMSATTLLAAEQFGVGGQSFGSAYDPSEITGDAGAAIRTELQYNREGDWSIIPSYQLYSFWDFGKVWIRNASPGQKESPSIASTGLGMRFNILQPISGGVEVGLPLTKLVNANGQDGRSPRAFFSLAYRY